MRCLDQWSLDCVSVRRYHFKFSLNDSPFPVSPDCCEDPRADVPIDKKVLPPHQDGGDVPIDKKVLPPHQNGGDVPIDKKCSITPSHRVLPPHQNGGFLALASATLPVCMIRFNLREEWTFDCRPLIISVPLFKHRPFPSRSNRPLALQPQLPLFTGERDFASVKLRTAPGTLRKLRLYLVGQPVNTQFQAGHFADSHAIGAVRTAALRLFIAA
eukprot:797277-Pleurochrysis_carterae.AAC.1